MSAQSMLQNIVGTRPPSDASEYSYPAEALVIEFKNAGNRVHLIFGSGDTLDAPGVLYNNAPNGSVYIPLTAEPALYCIFVKFGLAGLINGTWVATPALT